MARSESVERTGGRRSGDFGPLVPHLVVLVDEDGEETLVDLYLIFGEHRLRAVEFECIANDEPVVISGYWVGQRLMRRAKQILEGYQPARLEVVTCL